MHRQRQKLRYRQSHKIKKQGRSFSAEKKACLLRELEWRKVKKRGVAPIVTD